MAGEFTVKILSSEDFDKLPFKRIQANPGVVLGAAQMSTKTAFVRDTGFNDLTKANIGHELDELMAATSPHEEDGIRYKDFSQSFGNFASNIPLIGGIAKPLGQLAGGGLDLLGAGAGKLGLPNFNIGSPSVTQFGNQVRADKLASGFGSGFGSSKGANTAISSGINAASNASNARNFAALGNTQTAGGGGGGSNFLNSFFTGAKNVFGGGGTSGGGSIFGGGGGGTQQPFNLAETLGSVAPGVATALLGKLFTPKTDALDFGGIKDELRGRIGEGGSPAFDLGFGEAQRQLEGEPGTIPPAVLAEMDLRRDEEIEALENRFRINQQGGGISESDTSRFGELRGDIVKKFEALKQQTEFDFQREQEGRRVQVMQTVLNLDQAQFEQFTQIANLEIAEIIERYSVDVRTATDFKNLFGNVGGALIQSGLNNRTA